MLAIDGEVLPPNVRSEGWRKRIATRTTVISAAGYLTIAAPVLGFGVWAATAPISGAVVAGGVVAAAGPDTPHLHDLFNVADRRLYLAKAGGRDRIVADDAAPEAATQGEAAH